MPAGRDMTYRLRNGVHYCVTGDRAIFVDLATGRYFCLSRDLDVAFRQLHAEQAVCGRLEDAIDRLASDGLLVHEAGSEHPHLLPHPPRLTTGTVIQGSGRQTTAIVARALLAQIRAPILLRTRRLSDILEMVRTRRNRRRGARDAHHATVRDINAAFDATNLIFPPFGRCLPRSLAFVLVCNDLNIWPSLVIGVRTNPFVAHCWVQQEHEILQDDSGEAARFTPILVA